MTIVENLQKRISKAAKGVHVAALDQSAIASNRVNIPTPAYDLNRVISGSLFKGLPDKSLTMLVGPEGSFKSSFEMLCTAAGQKEGFTPVIIDTEGGVTGKFATRWGVNIQDALYIFAPMVSDVEIILGELLDNQDGTNYIISLDSLGGLFRRKVLDDMSSSSTGIRDAPKQDQGSLQKDIKRMLKLFLYLIKSTGSIGMMSGHFYGNPNSYGGADEIGGGKFAKLAPDIIISFKKQNLYENPQAPVRDRIIKGSMITAVPLKNRFYPPFQEAQIEINYKEGINSNAGMLDLAIKAGIFSKGGAWFTYEHTGEKFQGEKNARALLEGENKKEILEKIDKWLENSNYSTINKDVELEFSDTSKEE